MANDQSENAKETLAKWRRSIGIDAAWFEFGHPRQKEQYRLARDQGVMDALQALMLHSLFGDLSSGEFAAYGFRTAPNPSDGPVKIPEHVFDQRPPYPWDGDTVGASGWIYDRVRIERVSTSDSAKATGAEVEDEATPQADSNATMPNSEAPAKRGRHTYITEAIEVFEYWATHDPSKLRISPEKFADDFNERFFKMNPSFKGNVNPIAARTLRGYLREYLSRKVAGNGRK